MLRTLARSCQSALKLHLQSKTQTVSTLTLTGRRALFTQHEYEHNTILKKPALASATISSRAAPITNESDSDYVPYPSDMESGNKIAVLAAALRERFRLTPNEMERIIGDDQVQRFYRNRYMIQALDTLILEGISKQSVIEYPWLLALDHKRLELKLQLVKTMQMTDINHFVPFLRLTIPRLRKLIGALNSEANELSQMNRVYYISEKLEVPPEIVTKYLCKRLFILEMPFDMFEKNLQHMINYNVSPINILKDLWAFRYTPKSVELRLERAKRAKKGQNNALDGAMSRAYITTLSLDELQVLGNFSSVVEYLAHRLDFSVSEAKVVMDRHPQVHTVRVTKIKEVLDYLLNEAKFTRFEIAQVPRILCHSLKTTRQRMDELASHGCRPSTLVILCRSRREYEKFLNQWLSTHKTTPETNTE